MPDPSTSDRDGRRYRLGGVTMWIWKFYGRFVRMLTSVVFGTILIAIGVLFVNYVVLSTPKGRAYRD